MIPPLTPGQTEEQQNMVGWKNTFNMRHVTLMNLAASHIGIRNGSLNEIPSYRRSHCMPGPAKSLDLLRKNLQSAINKDIDAVIKKYLEKFFQPAISNIKNNLGKDSVTEDHINDVCRQMLEEAKSMYAMSLLSRDASPYDGSDSEGGNFLECHTARMVFTTTKRKESDNDLENSIIQSNKRQKPRTFSIENQLHRLPSKREGPKWDPDRITNKTLFIMGAKANKVLGYGQTRGRLYVRHPELLRYSGDQEDKEWLSGKNLMPPSGGKAYLMLLEDIKELTQNDDYKNSPHLQLNELKGFEVPQFLINKIRAFVEEVRTDKKPVETFDYRQSQTPPNTVVDSSPSTPDTMHLLESRSVSTTSSKQSENLIHIPEVSPSSNNSFISSHLTPSPSSLLSPGMLMTLSGGEISNNNSTVMILHDQMHNHNSISSLLTGQMSSDNSQDF